MTQINIKVNNIIKAAQKELDSRTPRSAWDRGVMAYAIELLEDLRQAVNENEDPMAILSDGNAMDEVMRAGAASWQDYSWGGCSLIYDGDVADRLCCPSELKKIRNGQRRPNAREEWLDVQARALIRASYRVIKAVQAALMTVEEAGEVLEVEAAGAAKEAPKTPKAARISAPDAAAKGCFTASETAAA